jgi:hypothetical protein
MIEVLDKDQPRLLWYDESDLTLTAKIKRAVAYYEEKYEVEAVDVVVNLRQARNAKLHHSIGNLTVHRDKRVKHNYISVGFKNYKGFQRAIDE